MSNGNLILDEPEVIERFKKAVDRGVMKETREITASIKGNIEDDKLNIAIMRFEIILEQYDRDIELYDSIGISIDFSDRKEYQQLVDWLKELRDRRKVER